MAGVAGGGGATGDGYEPGVTGGIRRFAFEDEGAQGAQAQLVFALKMRRLDAHHLDCVADRERFLRALRRAQALRGVVDLPGQRAEAGGVRGILAGEPVRLGVGEVGEPRRAAALETARPARERGHRHRDQHRRQARRVAAQRQHQRERADADRERGQMRVARLPQHGPGVGGETVAARPGHAEQFVELGQRDDDGGGIGEADHHRVGQEVDDGAEPEQAHGQFHDADHERERDGVGDELFAAGGRELGQGRARQQRDHRHRAGGELVRGAPQRGHRHRQ